LGFKAAPKSSHFLKHVYQFSIAALYQFTSAADILLLRVAFQAPYVGRNVDRIQIDGPGHFQAPYVGRNIGELVLCQQRLKTDTVLSQAAI